MRLLDYCIGNNDLLVKLLGYAPLFVSRPAVSVYRMAAWRVLFEVFFISPDVEYPVEGRIISVLPPAS